MATVKKVKKYQKSGPPLRKPSTSIEVETGEPTFRMDNSPSKNMSRAAAQNAAGQIKKLKDIKSDKERISRYQDAINKAALETSLNYKKGGKVSKAKDGKWIQKATASIKKRGTEGKCTPITKPGCTGKAKALAKTFKKMAKKK
jgi:hypothetical protein